MLPRFSVCTVLCLFVNGSLAGIPDPDPPIAMCQDITVQLDATGNAFITASDVDAGSFYDFMLSIDMDTFDCTQAGTMASVMLMAENMDGQVDMCTAFVTVEDNLAPEITTCALPKEVEVPEGGSAALPDFTTDISAGDNCSVLLNITQSPPDGTVVTAGVHTVDIFVGDENGNTNSCSTTFTVIEVPPPDIDIISAVNLQFDTVSGRTYAVEYNDPLLEEPQVWLTVSNIPGTGGPVIIPDNDGATNRNYRLRVKLKKD